MPVQGVKNYTIGCILHYGIQHYSRPRTLLSGSAKNTDVWEMLVGNIAKEDGVYGKAVEASEEALRLITAKTAAEKRAATLKKLRGLYAGKGATLYKPYTVGTIAYDKRTKNYWQVVSDTRNNLKAALFNNINRINDQIFKPLRDAEYLIYVAQTKPIYCSAEFNSTICRELIGRQVWYRNLWLDHVQYHDNEQTAFDLRRHSRSLDYKFVAFVKNTE